MRLSNINPYGAVPEALSQSRLALRDIMADYLAQKTLEANLNVAQKKAEIETAQVAANLKLGELANERDLARTAAEAQRFERQQSFTEDQARRQARQWQQSFDETKRQHDENKRIQAEQIAESRRQFAMANKAYIPETIDKIVAEFMPGTSPEFRNRIYQEAGLNPNDKRTPNEMKSIVGALTPIIARLGTQDFNAAMAAANAAQDPQKKAAWQQKAVQIANQMHIVHAALRPQPLTDKDLIPLYHKGLSSGTIPEGTDYSTFKTNMQSTQQESQPFLEMANKAAQAQDRLKVDPNYDKKYLQALEVIRSLDDPKHVQEIAAGLAKREDDPAGALEYAQGWAKYLSANHKSKAKKQRPAPESIFYERFDQ